MSEASDPRLYQAHVVRNRGPILEVLRRALPPSGFVLEVASGGGEHAAYFAKQLPSISWQPTDVDPTALASIAAHRSDACTPNLLSPVSLNVASEIWPVEHADALVCINMIHITPWAVSEGLMAGAKRTLGVGDVLYLYGPYKIDGEHTTASNRDFDLSLRAQNPEWGLRDLAEVTDLAKKRGLELEECLSMPANNLSVIFRKFR